MPTISFCSVICRLKNLINSQQWLLSIVSGMNFICLIAFICRFERKNSFRIKLCFLSATCNHASVSDLFAFLDFSHHIAIAQLSVRKGGDSLLHVLIKVTTDLINSVSEKFVWIAKRTIITEWWSWRKISRACKYLLSFFLVRFLTQRMSTHNNKNEWIINCVNLPYNRMLESTSPNEFFAMQRYEPMSSFWNLRIVRVIRVSYSDSDVSCTLYLGDETIISPVDSSPLSAT